MKPLTMILFVVAVAVGLYAYYDNATYGTPGVSYKATCSFTDWLFRKCQTPTSVNAGIGVS